MQFIIQAKYLNIWFDILTPKQLLFFESMIRYIKKNHNVLCTSRNYNQVTDLAKIRGQKLVVIGKHGGAKKYDKLSSSLYRSRLLSTRIKKFSPDITISFCSPEAARVSYGLGIRHICFSDSPHAKAVMRLVIPLVQKLLIPWIIPKKEFTKFGIDAKDIINYKAIDAVVITKCKISKNRKNPIKKGKRKIILVRVEEEQAAYSSKKRPAIPIIRELIKNFHNENNLYLFLRYLNFGLKIHFLILMKL